VRNNSRQMAAKNVLMKDGTVRRAPEDQCEFLLETGQAKRYVSNTVYRAVKLGIEVKDHGTRDEKGALRKKIREARGKEDAKAAKKAAKEAAKEEAAVAAE